ncbi:hypothetical protein [Mycobacteroides abscessus]|uniref:hypothetical protein n=1 Tax=Mycobacteroides abscessus TaxID=36809 RepID=UPI0009272184|nr:hypothetical protein [Mycobacteroides abscessus]SIL07318.1 Uncharacterised protein [Mycobacteroides abscessus subsp. abscessus]
MSGRRHIERAKHHYSAFEYLRGDYPDWACVALFYSALHYVDATLVDDRQIPEYCRRPTVHNAPGGEGRTQIVNQYYGEIADEYRVLETTSRIARYQTDRESLGRLASLVEQLPKFLEKVRSFCEKRRASS